MFIIGCFIVIIYVYLLLKIIRKKNKNQRHDNTNLFDTNDLDGIGNQGRFPTKH